MKVKYEWKTLRTSGIELGTTLNEIEEKTDWEVFTMFSHKEKTTYRIYDTHIVIVVLRRPREEE